jgi:hypothetical protein
VCKYLLDHRRGFDTTVRRLGESLPRSWGKLSR